MITDPEIAKKHVIKMVESQALNCYSGKQIPCEIDSVCVHGDCKSAVDTAKQIREGLIKSGVTLNPLDKMKKFVQIIQKNQMNILRKNIKLLITLFIILTFPLNLNSVYAATGSGSNGKDETSLYKSGKKLVLRAKKLENKDKVEKAQKLYL